MWSVALHGLWRIGLMVLLSSRIHSFCLRHLHYALRREARAGGPIRIHGNTVKGTESILEVSAVSMRRRSGLHRISHFKAEYPSRSLPRRQMAEGPSTRPRPFPTSTSTSPSTSPIHQNHQLHYVLFDIMFIRTYKDVEAVITGNIGPNT
jgi:hypothetical protein